MTQRRVVVTGLGAVGPLGIGLPTTFDALLQGRSGIARLQAFDPAGFDAQIAGQVADLKIRDFVPRSYRKSAKVMAREIELAVAAAFEAVKDAGIKTRCMVERGDVEPPVDIDPTRLGVNIGAGLICADLTELAGALATSVEDEAFSYKEWGRNGINNLTPLWLLKYLPNMLTCHVTIVHDAQGPANTITCGEASSHLSIGEAFRAIARGAMDVGIAGGAESKISPMGLIRQSLLGRLATDCNDRPEEACRPFDANRTGMVISEGGGLLVLEELQRARSRDAYIYAELVGFASANDTHDWNTAPDPQGQALALAIRKALAEASLSPDQVDLVVATGNGLPDHDLSEARALHAALGEHAARVPVMATKGALGNNGAGSGAIDLALACQAMRRQVVPPSPNTASPDPKCAMNVVARQPLETGINTMLSVSYALGGGQNAALLLRRWQQ